MLDGLLPDHWQLLCQPDASHLTIVFVAAQPAAKIGSLASDTQTFTHIGSMVASHPASGLGAEIDLREAGMLASKKSKHQVTGSRLKIWAS